MNNNRIKIILLALIYVVISFSPAYSIIGPTLMLDNKEQNENEFTFGIGPTLRYKHNESSALDFRGDMAMCGVRIVGGPMNDPKFGLNYCAGEQTSEMLKYNLVWDINSHYVTINTRFVLGVFLYLIFYLL